MHYFSSFKRSPLRWWPAGLVFLWAALSVQATSVEPPSFDELVNQSDYIVRAVVKSVVAEYRTAPDGSRMIHSKVELEVRQVIAGKPPVPLILDVLGGTLDGRELAIEGAPKFKAGDESIFFVQGNGTQIYPLVRMMHGLYRVQTDAGTGRESLARSNGAPLHDVNEVSAPFDQARSASAAPALSPADFVLKIRATARRPQLLEN